MTFKEQLKADVNNVFMNPLEFADLHNINGKQIVTIIDEEASEEYEKLQQYDFDGLYKVSMIVYLNSDSLEKIPAIKSSLTVDGKKYFVLNTSKPDGMLKIILGVNMA